ncbi:hypothetical protein [Solibacillus isronensis]|uniref:hypothetical protein n=1 Tax=Solibacillus isronensis TaxID=412383 RepID=UPI002041CAE7|nr:hypothetical protein [Solibacillus isronensis]MCM3723990.1 hypothetical protein [Solibacillus isronensis]
MKKINMSIVLNIIMIIFLLATFYWQYDQLFVTRITLVVFALIYLLFEVKKEYISKNKMVFIIFSAISLISIIISIIIDNSSVNNVPSDRDYLIPVFTFTLIVIMYKDFYAKKQ